MTFTPEIQERLVELHIGLSEKTHTVKDTLLELLAILANLPEAETP